MRLFVDVLERMHEFRASFENDEPTNDFPVYRDVCGVIMPARSFHAIKFVASCISVEFASDYNIARLITIAHFNCNAYDNPACQFDWSSCFRMQFATEADSFFCP